MTARLESATRHSVEASDEAGLGTVRVSGAGTVDDVRLERSAIHAGAPELADAVVAAVGAARAQQQLGQREVRAVTDVDGALRGLRLAPLAVGQTDRHARGELILSCVRPAQAEAEKALADQLRVLGVTIEPAGPDGSGAPTAPDRRCDRLVRPRGPAG